MRFMLIVAAAALIGSSVGCQSTGSSCGGGCPLGGAASCGCGDCDTGCCGCGDASCGGCGSCVCDGCGGGGCGKCGGCGLLSKATCGAFGSPGDQSALPCGPGDAVYDFQPGPPSGQVAYPYYTTKGPGDFLSPRGSTVGPGY